MKIFKTIKFTGLAAIVMSVAVGCASTQNQQEEPKAEAPKGPSAAEKACAAAEAARKKAASVGGEWRDIGKMIKKAKKAMKDGDDKTAIKLCDKARIQGELGYEQALRERGVKQGGNSYTVSKGDSLWSISGKDSIYGNPYQWPLIYKANRDIIKDADLIYPGQDLAINRSASAADVDAAVRHARTRGAWAVGPVEASDKAYLGQ